MILRGDTVQRFKLLNRGSRAEETIWPGAAAHIDVTLTADAAGLGIAKLLKQAGLSPCTSAALQIVAKGGVKLDGEKLSGRILIAARTTRLPESENASSRHDAINFGPHKFFSQKALTVLAQGCIM